MALSGTAFSQFGGGISDLYAASADRARGQGARIEAEQYLKSAAFADLNATYTKELTNIKEYQAQRAIFKTMGSQRADVAASGFAKSGSALDLERDSATQGALTKAVLGAQGQIEEAGYEQQAASYRLMADSANLTATAADHAAQGATFASYLHFAASGISLFGGGAPSIQSNQQEQTGAFSWSDPTANPWAKNPWADWSPGDPSPNTWSWQE